MSLVGQQSGCNITFGAGVTCTATYTLVYTVTCTLTFKTNPAVFTVLNGAATLGTISVANGTGVIVCDLRDWCSARRDDDVHRRAARPRVQFARRLVQNLLLVHLHWRDGRPGRLHRMLRQHQWYVTHTIFLIAADV